MKNRKYLLLLLFVVAALTASSLVLWARPLSIRCPIDSQIMVFDHQVGYGNGAACWYSHIAAVPSSDGRGLVTVKHEAYVPCGD